MTKEVQFSRTKWLFLFFLIGLLGIFVFGFFVIILLPIPGIYLIIHDHRWVWGIGSVAAVVALLIGLGSTPIHILVLIFIYTLITILFYVGIKRSWSPQKTIFCGAVLGIFALLIGFGLFFLGADNTSFYTFLEKQRQAINQLLDKYQMELGQYQRLDGVREQVDWINENKELIVKTFLKLTPSFLIGLIFISLYIDFFIIQSILSNPGARFHVEKWRLNDLWPWAVVAGLGLMMTKIGFLRVIAWNILIIMCVIYLTQGVSVFLFFLNHSKIGSIGKIILFILGFLFFYFYPVLMLIGFSDTWIDFRKLKIKRA